MPTSTNFGYLLYCTRVQAMPRPEEGAPPEHDNTPITSSEIISPDSTFDELLKLAYQKIDARAVAEEFTQGIEVSAS
jgi:hypothetical protein